MRTVPLDDCGCGGRGGEPGRWVDVYTATIDRAKPAIRSFRSHRCDELGPLRTSFSCYHCGIFSFSTIQDPSIVPFKVPLQ